MLGSSSTRSAPILVVLRHETEPEDDDHEPGWYRVEAIMSREPSAAEWFARDAREIGPRSIFGDEIESWRSRWVVVLGCQWTTRYYYPEPDFDAGFDVDYLAKGEGALEDVLGAFWRALALDRKQPPPACLDCGGSARIPMKDPCPDTGLATIACMRCDPAAVCL